MYARSPQCRQSGDSTYIAGIDGERVTSDLHPPLYPRLTSNVAYEKREREVSSHVS